MHRPRILTVLIVMALMAAASPLWAQSGNTLTIAFPGVPTGNCAFMMQASDVADGTNYFCNALTHAWYLGGGGASPVTPSGTLTLNHLMLGGGTTVAKVDSACVTDGAGALSGCASVSAGTAPTACGSATGCFGATAASTASTQTASQGSCRLDSTTGWWLCRHANGGAEVPVGSAYIPAAASGAIGAASVANGPSQMITCSATCSWTPISPPVLGAQFCVTMKAGVTGTITLNALGNSAQYGKTDGSAYGTAGTGTAVSTSTTGNQICGYASSTTTYETNSRSSFTMN